MTPNTCSSVELCLSRHFSIINVKSIPLDRSILFLQRNKINNEERRKELVDFILNHAATLLRERMHADEEALTNLDSLCQNITGRNRKRKAEVVDDKYTLTC